MSILAAAYAEISTRRVCDSLGAERAEAIALAEKAGMAYDADADVLRAAPHAATTAAARDEPNSHGVSAIRSVTETALLLEQVCAGFFVRARGWGERAGGGGLTMLLRWCDRLFVSPFVFTYYLVGIYHHPLNTVRQAGCAHP